MRTVMQSNPLSVFSFYAIVVCITAASSSPVIQLLSLIGAVACNFGYNTVKKAVFSIVLFVLMAILNPLFNTSGATALFFINDFAITLEAVLYGVSASLSITAVIYWFFSFSRIMTGEKIIYLFGKLSPHIALLISSVIRFVPMFLRLYSQSRKSQICMGICKNDTVINKLKCEIRVLSVMITRCTENGIITADSMEARGYGNINRTCFSFYKLRLYDIIYVIIYVLLAIVTVFAIASGCISFEYYPTITVPKASPLTYASYICWAALVFLPTLTQAGKEIKWKYLLSRI